MRAPRGLLRGMVFLWASPAVPEGTAKLTWGASGELGLGTQVRKSAMRGHESGQDVGGGG